MSVPTNLVNSPSRSCNNSPRDRRSCWSRADCQISIAVSPPARCLADWLGPRGGGGGHGPASVSCTDRMASMPSSGTRSGASFLCCIHRGLFPVVARSRCRHPLSPEARDGTWRPWLLVLHRDTQTLTAHVSRRHCKYELRYTISQARALVKYCVCCTVPKDSNQELIMYIEGYSVVSVRSIPRNQEKTPSLALRDVQGPSIYNYDMRENAVP